ncbi:hypothetical protein JCM8208_006932, partial [Rhodotorula glutinis]
METISYDLGDPVPPPVDTPAALVRALAASVDPAPILARLFATASTTASAFETLRLALEQVAATVASSSAPLSAVQLYAEEQSTSSADPAVAQAWSAILQQIDTIREQFIGTTALSSVKIIARSRSQIRTALDLAADDPIPLGNAAFPISRETWTGLAAL